MAQKVEVRLLDDLDGSPADGTVKFALDGVEYEIDLSSKHALDLRQALDPFLGAARRVGRVGSGGRRGGASGAGASPGANRERNQAIREWAKGKGLEVSDRGRISQELVEQYQAETGK
jgi:nucleoid-associated protein Lsr2